MDAKYHFLFIFLTIIVALFSGFIIYTDIYGGEGLSFFDRTCGDGTPYGECSLRNPYFCSDGLLFERASECGCPPETNLSGDFCISEYQTNPIDVNLKYNVGRNEKILPYTVYGGMAGYLLDLPKTISYQNGETITRLDFKLKAIEEPEQEKLLSSLVVEIQNLADNDMDQLRIATTLVQNLEWGYSDKIVNFGSYKLNYSRYPYEVLSDSRGLCGEKSELLAFLLKELGYGVAIFYNQQENHESVGVKCPLEKSWKETGYCFIETSGPSIITDDSIEYVNGLRITSEPQVMIISDGKSLEEDIPEYKDAETLAKLRTKLNQGTFNLFDGWKYERLRERYNFKEVYNLD
jgi:hypothetical protein